MIEIGSFDMRCYDCPADDYDAELCTDCRGQYASDECKKKLAEAIFLAETYGDEDAEDDMTLISQRIDAEREAK